MAQMFDFSGKSVFVMGGTSGINYGIACGFAEWGAKVFVASRKQDKVDAAVEGLQKFGAEAAGFACDVRDYDAVADAFVKATEFFGGSIDILVSGAAGNFPARLLDMSPNAMKSVVDIDLLGTFHVMRACHEHLTKPGASVINISAPQAYLPMSYQSHVCAAKAGVDMVTRTLSLEWGKEGIRVNSIVPGPIDNTEGMARLTPTPELKELVTKSVPIGRLGEVSDIANAAGLLSSEAGSYISGVILPVDGAWSQAGATSVMGSMARFMDKMQSN
ncbi:MAG: SDR family oxidoreductase [Pseudomonadota bacterium]